MNLLYMINLKMLREPTRSWSTTTCAISAYQH